MRSRAACLLLLALTVGCDGDPGADAGPEMDAEAARDAGAATEDAAAAHDADVRPDPGCLVPDVGGDVTFAPEPPRAGQPLSVFVTDDVAHTNVGLYLCTSAGRVEAAFQSVSGAFTWEYEAPALPPGDAQVVFFGDPDETVHATARITIGEAVDAGVPDAGPPAAPCDWPADSLVDGRFDDGLDGLAPPGWQVRDPDAPARCGDPAEHVYVIDPPPGCGGSALAVDARGEWDCYAIQVFTDYDTIRGGHTYRVGATVRSTGRENPGGWFFLGLQWLDGADRVFGDERNPRVEPLDFDWRRIEFDVVAPSEARRAVLWLTAHYEGRVDFDGVSMVER